MTVLDHTHDPAARSWLDSANEAGCDFPIQNLPFGVFRRQGSGEVFRSTQPKCLEGLPIRSVSRKA